MKDTTLGDGDSILGGRFDRPRGKQRYDVRGGQARPKGPFVTKPRVKQWDNDDWARERLGRLMLFAFSGHSEPLIARLIKVDRFAYVVEGHTGTQMLAFKHAINALIDPTEDQLKDHEAFIAEEALTDE